MSWRFPLLRLWLDRATWATLWPAVCRRMGCSGGLHIASHHTPPCQPVLPVFRDGLLYHTFSHALIRMKTPTLPAAFGGSSSLAFPCRQLWDRGETGTTHTKSCGWETTNVDCEWLSETDGCFVITPLPAPTPRQRVQVVALRSHCPPCPRRNAARCVRWCVWCVVCVCVAVCECVCMGVKRLRGRVSRARGAE